MVYTKKFTVESHMARTLNPREIKKHKDGWEIKGEVHEDYFKWVNEFKATHPVYGKVWGDFEKIVYATDKKAFDEFLKNHEPVDWDYWDI